MKKDYLCLFGLLALTTQLSFSQEVTDTIKSQNIEEIKINSKKFTINKNQTPSQIEIFSKEKIEFQNFQTTADMLANSGSLFVQKSQQGAGSPVIRGFEASRVLLLVDGVRMNNLIFRAGHLQNIITVDENFLETALVQYGPTSSLYGSDALGGSVNMITKRAKFGDGFTGNVNTRYSSVNEEKSGYFDINYGTTNFASLTAFSYNDFGDLKMGRTKNHNGEFFGERIYYAENNYSNATDVNILNPDKYTQVGTAYKQWNFMQKFMYETKSKFKHSVNFQYSNTTDVPRYDRLTERSGGNMTFAEWYYGPQKRLLGVYSLEKDNFFGKTNFRLDASYQDVEESRNDRRFNNAKLRTQLEEVAIYSVNAHFNTPLLKGNLYYGIENYYETLNSSATRVNIYTGEPSEVSTRYPDGNNSLLRNELYASFSKTKEKWHYNIGGRIGQTNLKSQIVNNSAFNFPFTEINQHNITYSVNAGLVHNTSENFILKTNIGTGYRAPNIDDLAKIFDTSPNAILVIPNNDLGPETTVTSDFGFVLKSKNNKHNFEATYYYTAVNNVIVTKEFSLNGATQIDNDNDGIMSTIFASQNDGKAFITGFNGNIKTTLARNLEFNGSYNVTLGRVTASGNRRPLDHIPPYYGKVGFSYVPKWAVFEAYMLFNGKKHLKDYSTSGEDNLAYAPANGMPAWETYNFKASSKQIFGFTLYAGMENILDTQYRNFASGINAGGRNIYGGAKYSF
ncbi:TonB-dependent receptor plug domain-containing protein [Flavobacterium terrigena]|uniref:Hemoglobin/transferrin/lactoferrin receptor protein n=1 Tax=Flavobacterium terrigena TaxID=402734 RepID=A0A1H6VA63_9FLAO|nr:TonB-dependent receptor [Flavobacterium terrigena]SEI99834.1 hemoglobin/transferrin/lactoferrin receptor protein [Flavobacterium terrigena]